MSEPLKLVEDLDFATPPGIAQSPWLWVGVGVAVIVAIPLIFRLGKRVHAKLTAPPSPEKVALVDLSAIEASMASLDAREFATHVSLILRVYIEGRFGLHAPRRSTEEFLLQAKGSPALSAEQQQWTGDILVLCDRSKFALAELADETQRELLTVVRDFVVATTPKATAA